MRERDMNMGRKSEMLRSTGKNGQKRNIYGPVEFSPSNETWRRVA